MLIRKIPRFLILLLFTSLLASACQPAGMPLESGALATSASQGQAAALPDSGQAAAQATPSYPRRPLYSPGELVDYTAQGGDTLQLLARRFNTSVAEILEANTFIPASATTMPAGMPMKIPIYYLPLWGSPYRILPDSLFVNGPAQVNFNTQEFIDKRTGWLKYYETYVSHANRSGAQIVDMVARDYSVSPRLLLALLEYKSGALSQPSLPAAQEEFALGGEGWSHKGLYLQLTWAANLLNNSYYGFKNMQLSQLEFHDGRIENFDPWQNAASVSLMFYFNTVFEYPEYLQAISPEGFARIYASLFGDPWQNEQAHIPGSLVQPEFILPFQPGDVWALTGGPHTAWGIGNPLAALDFAPPSKTSGCVPSGVWATAVSPGVVVRSEEGQVMLDLDGDGDERTGWNVFYLHVGTESRVPLGVVMKQGDPIGHPSCEGGAATGTHIHIARKYNGEWVSAEGMGGVLAFTLEGWEAHNGRQPYLGTLTRFSQVVTACTCSNAASFIQSDRRAPEASR